MKYFNQYVVTKRFKKKALCGDLNLPFGTKCFAKDGAIYCEKGIICGVTSQDAYDFFSQNDDGCAELRRQLIGSIFNALNRSKQSIESYNERWDKVWNDATCLKYKREEYDDHWLWNYDFYNAEIDMLRHIAKLIDAKEVA